MNLAQQTIQSQCFAKDPKTLKLMLMQIVPPSAMFANSDFWSPCRYTISRVDTRYDHHICSNFLKQYLKLW